MNVQRNWVLVMLIAGGLAGLAACTVIQGTDFTLNVQSYGTYGIDAITVALLGRAGRWAWCGPGCCSARCTPGRRHAGRHRDPGGHRHRHGALVVLFVAAPPLIRAIFRLRSTGGSLQVLSRGWNG